MSTYLEFYVVSGAEYVDGKGWRGFAVMARGGTRIAVVANLRDVDAAIAAWRARSV